jgi:hypothetical protein
MLLKVILFVLYIAILLILFLQDESLSTDSI